MDNKLKPDANKTYSSLHPSQENIYYDQILTPNSIKYNIGNYELLENAVDKEIFFQVWQILYQSVDALSINIAVGDNLLPVQSFTRHNDPLTKVKYFDFSDQAEKATVEPLTQAIEWANNSMKKPINFYDQYLFEIALIKLSAEKFLFFIKSHHIINDGFGLFKLREYYHQLYHCLKNNLSTDWLADIPKLAPQIEKQQQYIDSHRYQQDKAYWQKTIKIAQTGSDLNPYCQSGALKTHSLAVPQHLVELLAHYTHQHQQSILSIISAGLAVYLKVKLASPSFNWELPIHNRPNSQAKKTIGMFANVLSVTTHIPEQITFHQLISQISNDIGQKLKHGRFPTSHIQRLAGSQENPTQAAIQIVHDLFKGQNVSDGQSGDQSNRNKSDDKFTTIQLDNGEESHGLQVRYMEYASDTCKRLRISYSTQYFDEAEIKLLAERLFNILECGLTQADIEIKEIPLTTEQERRTLVKQYNNTSTDYPYQQTLHQLFEQQVTKTPQQLALVFEEKQYTYLQLNQLANQLATSIRQAYEQRGKPLQADKLISLYFDKSAAMIISILAVLKAGGAYVPISPDYPQDRTLFILQDIGADLLLTQQKYIDSLSTITAMLEPLASQEPSAMQEPMLIACDKFEQLQANLPTNNLAPISQASDLAYIIYTSGTTGKPKGVMIEHQNAVHCAYALTQRFKVKQCHKALVFSAYVFDANIFELYTALSNGLTLYVASEKQRQDQHALIELIRQKQIDIALLPPALLAVLPEQQLSSLRILISAGEAPSMQMVQRYQSQCLLFNAYGPTEVTVISTAHLYQPDDMATCIGQPIDNVKHYVLDQQLKLVPTGAIGELYLGGPGVSRGYLNRPELTQERFIDNPFATEEEKAKGWHKLYKSGDLVRWLPLKNNQAPKQQREQLRSEKQTPSLLYLGRNDCQVKIRGHRIELGEIECALSEHAQIKQAVVVENKTTDSARLAAYYVLESAVKAGQSISSEALNKHLASRLPEYMMPGSYTQLDAIPLTINGKTDRHALPEPEFLLADNYLAPSTELEKKLCKIWAQTLGLDKVGVRDNFFMIGGDSILAVRLCAAVSTQLKLALSVAQLFEHKTVAVLVPLLDSSDTIDIPKYQGSQAPLSFAQERLWFIEQFEQGSNAYHIPYLLKLRNNCILDTLVESICHLLNRHEILTTVFQHEEQGKYYQLSLGKVAIKQFYSSQSVNDKDALAQALHQDMLQVFDLTCEPPVKVRHYALAGHDEQYLLINFHHIAFDGWSRQIFGKELALTYQAFTQHQTPDLPAIDIQYKDFAAWQIKQLNADKLEKLSDYWVRQLADYQNLDLAIDFARPAVQQTQGNNYDFSLDVELSARLKSLAAQLQTTLNSLLLSGFYITLAKLSGQQDIVIGSPSDNRQYAQIENMLGFFVNTLALRCAVAPETSLTELIAQVHQTVIDAKRHQELPFEKLVHYLNIERDPSRQPICQVIFSMEGFQKSPEEQGLPFSPVNWHVQGDKETSYMPAKHDLTLFIVDDADCTKLKGQFNYAVSLFKAQSIQRICHFYVNILEAIVKDPSIGIGQIDYLSESEKHQLLYQFNDTVRKPDPGQISTEQTLAGLFAQQVQRYPDKPALVFQQESLTYAQLNLKAEKLANELAKYPVQSGDFVAVLADRSLDFVVAILTVIKAGAAYIPLDINTPPERIDYILKDAGVKAVIRQAQIEPSPYLESKSIDSKSPASQSDSNSSQDMAYVIYTSGTTGKPKGVCIRQLSLINLASWHIREMQVSADSIATQVASFAFDASVWEIWPYLLSGACIHITNNQLRQDISHLSQYIAVQGITHCFIPTPLLNSFIDQIKPLTNQLQVVTTGGDKLPSFRHTELPFKVYNCYGPTEACVVTTAMRLDKNYDFKGYDIPPIGSPIDNTQVYILDSAKNLLPLGATGELYIGGLGLASAYLNQTELSQRAFIRNPFDPSGESKLYKTGDLCCWLPNAQNSCQNKGQLQYISRCDHQLKIRGFRIEPGEIEAVLASHPDIRQAVVVLIKQNSELLTAYYVAQDGQTPSEESLTDYLSSKLPDYMLPQVYVELSSIPLSNNGKIDYKALPKPNLTKEQNYTAPRDELEQQMCHLWCKLLGLEKVGVKDKFFAMGGNSLLVVQLKTQLQQQIGINVPISTLFKYPDIRSLANFLLEQRNTSDKPLSKQARSNKQKVSDIAVIGMAGQFPGAKNIDEFWQNLKHGIESIQFFNTEDAIANGADEALCKQPNYITAAGLLDDTELFDAGFFGYPPLEAKILDPQQRLLLETAWTALEHAGYNADEIKVPVGVFAGSGKNSYESQNLWPNQQYLAERVSAFQLLTASDKDFVANRLAYHMNLKGPAVSVQTACSTSLVAIQTAVKSLMQGDCQMAIAGGVSIAFPQKLGYLHQDGMIMSPDGHCRTFDADAKGTVRGSGVGVVVLKPLADALQDGDSIHAVIKGAAVNNDGINKVSFTAPGVDGQAAVIQKAMQGLDYESIGYIEAHGTGTELGDPIEIAAITQAYSQYTDKTAYCAIGSVKTNIGHLDAAAGVAGFIKTVQALKHGQIPPNLHYVQPNPHIDFANSPVYVNTQVRDWAQTHSGPKRAAVSSFGIGGTNAHIVLQEAPPQPAQSQQPEQAQLLCLSARTPEALEQAKQNLTDYLRSHQTVNLADVAFTLLMGRKAFEHRATLVAKDCTDAITKLGQSGGNRAHSSSENHSSFENYSSSENNAIFLFPGQGSQHPDMAKALYDNYSIYRETIDQCAQILGPIAGQDIRKILYNNDDSDLLNNTQWAQPTLFVTEYALTKLIRSFGVDIHSMIGHSLGEYVAACVAGVMSLTDALKIIALRGKLMSQRPSGAMLAVNLAEEQLTDLLTPVKEVAIAAINAPNQVVVSGSLAATEQFAAVLEQNNIEFRHLNTSHAFHSPMMQAVIPEFKALLQSITLKPPQIPFISNLTGDWISSEQATSVDYWCQHLLNPVRFAKGITTLLAKQESLNCPLLHAGPGQTLASLIRQNKAATPVISTLSKQVRKQTDSQANTQDEITFLSAMGRLWSYGLTIKWPAQFSGIKPRRIPLPTYPFERKRYWLEGSANKVHTQKQPLDKWFYQPTWAPAPALSQDTNSQPLVIENWLIFSGTSQTEQALYRALYHSLFQALKKPQPIQVMPGSDFNCINEFEYRIDPASPQHYQQLFEQLAAKQKLPQGIIHLWTAKNTSDDNISNDSDLNYVKKHGLYSLIYLAQNWPETDQQRQLFVVSSQRYAVTPTDTLTPAKALLSGPVENIELEYPHISCRNIDISLTDDYEQIANDIAQECQYSIDPKSWQKNIVYRYGQRWQRHFNPLRLAPMEIHSQGVWLITGGLGWIGFNLAGYLAKQTQAKLVLLHRSPLSDDSGNIKNKRLQQLQSSGAEILLLQADVSDFSQLQTALHQAQQKLGPITGIIHCAGIADGNLIELSNAESIERVLAAKVDGTLNLSKLIKPVQLKHFVLCSSLNAFMPYPGHTVYTSANAWLDSYAHALRQHKVNITSINWDGWKTSGMAADAQLSNHLYDKMQALESNGLNADEGIEAFSRIISQTNANLAVSTLELGSRLAQNKSLSALHDIEHTQTNQPDVSQAPTSGTVSGSTPGSTQVTNPGTKVEQTLLNNLQNLLGIESIDIQDNLYELGADSLLVIQLIAKLQKNLAVKVSLKEMMQRPIIADQAEYIQSLIEVKQTLATIDKAPVGSLTPLSSSQQRLWFLEQIELANRTEYALSPYNMSMVFSLKGQLNIAALRQSWETLVKRHQSLRYRFPVVDGNATIELIEAYDPLVVINISDKTTHEQNNYFEKWLAMNEAASYDLNNGPLLRLECLIKTDEHILYLAMHHIISDAWSMDILLREWQTLYNTLIESNDLSESIEPRLPAIELDYSDYAYWQQRQLNSSLIKQHEDYWLQQLQDAPPLSELPPDFPRPAKIKSHGRIELSRLDAALSQQIKQLSAQYNVSVFVILFAAYNLLISRFNGQQDLVIGVPVANRNQPEISDMVGFFVNTLALRTRLNSQQSFSELIRQLNKNVLDAFNHQEVPFNYLVEQLNPPRSASYTPIFQQIFQLSQGKASSQLKLKNLTSVLIPQQVSTAKFDLSLSVDDNPDHMLCLWEYNTNLYRAETISRLAEHFTTLLGQIITRPDVAIQDYQWLSHTDKQQLDAWNKTASEYPATIMQKRSQPLMLQTLQKRFEQQVAQTPQQTALVWEQQRYSYEQLNQLANQLAHSLLEQHSIKPDDLIALYFDRHALMLISILAVLKTGAAYVPISPDFPKDRTQFILGDTSAKLVLTHVKYLSELSEQGEASAHVIATDGFSSYQPGLADHNPKTECLANNLAYVIYTSGTTGHPKGVMIEHHTVGNFVDTETAALDLSDCKNALLYTAYVFDAQVFELFVSLFNGMTIYLASEQQRKNIPALSKLLQAEQIDFAIIPPALLPLVPLEAMKSLKVLITGGETPPLERLNQLANKMRVYNVYGPTECTVCATSHLFRRGDAANNIGPALSNYQLFVLDQQLQAVPIGAIGELYIGGIGLARGYLNRSELTAERFIDNPFATEVDIERGWTRLYKTGDLVRFVGSDLHFLGRNDFQVKIRGHRIELGEIEYALSLLPGISQAVVIDVKQHNTFILAAYYVAESCCQLSKEQIHDKLASKLPDYMLPQSIMPIDAIPLTLNGKTNRSALPIPELSNSSQYIAPGNELEQHLCEIWAEVLGQEKIGIRDNFFSLGGDSIAAVRLSAAVAKALQLDLPLALIFEHKTIAALSNHLSAQKGHSEITPLQLTPSQLAKEKQTTAPLSFAQERLWFIEQFEQGTNAYHIPVIYKLTEDTNLPALKQAVLHVIAQQPILTTIYQTDQDDNNVQQYLRTSVEDSLWHTQTVNDLSQLNTLVQADMAKVFDLSSEPSIRIHHYFCRQAHAQAHVNKKANNQANYLLINIHHIAFDGWSTQIFNRQLAEAYQAFCHKQEPTQAPDNLHYRDFAVWQRQYLQGETLEALTQYWQHTLSGFSTLELPTDFNRPAQYDTRGGNFIFNLDADFSQQLRQLAKQQQTTLNSVLLAAFYLTLYRLSGQHDIVIGTPSDNRSHPQIQEMIGFFVNSLVLRTQIKPSQTLTDFIAQVHQLVSQAKQHQELPFEKLVDSLQTERDPSRHPIFQVMFSLQNFETVPNSLPFTDPNWQYDNNEITLTTPAKTDLSLDLMDNPQTGQITGGLVYASSLFKAQSIERLADIYQTILRSMVQLMVQLVNTQAQAQISQVDYLPEQQKQTLLELWNNTSQSHTSFNYPSEQTLQQLFEQQVRQTPNSLALVINKQEYSYLALNQLANQLAHSIKAKIKVKDKVKPDTLIALYVDRSAAMIISILAVLKTGAAYVPLAPDYPEARTVFILQDTRTPLLLTQNQYLTQLQSTIAELSQPPQIMTTDAFEQYQAGMRDSNPKLINQPTDLAYIIYTSGTSGQPKGVMISHANIVPSIKAHDQAFEISGKKRAMLFSAYMFDSSVYEVFGPLSNGLSLYIATETERKDSVALGQLIKQNQIDFATISPALLPILDKEAIESIKILITGGETPAEKEITRLRQYCKVFNAYGPTEATITASYHAYQSGDSSAIIGQALDTVNLYVLDQQQQLLPIGAVGELYIGGVQIARGYLNQEQLSNERFISNPFASEDDIANGWARLYKTGDLVKWCSAEDGLSANLLFFGRNDFQVKIRGHRIELAEIETALSTHPAIKQTVVIDHKHNEQLRLAAYFVSEQGQQVSSATLHKYISAKLPEYMLPASFTELAEIPLTVTDKLNRCALPDPQLVSAQAYLAPRNNGEAKLCQVWAEVLGVAQIGINDNFFRSGGDSITSIQLVNKLRKTGFIVQVKDIFEAPTVAQLAALPKQSTGEPDAEQGLLNGEFALLPIQHAFMAKPIAKSHHYNQSFSINLPKTVSTEQIQALLKTLAGHHDNLRCVFSKHSAIYTENSTMAEFQQLNVTDLSEAKIQQQLTEWQSHFNLEKGPLWATALLRGETAQGQSLHRLWFALHHMIIDAVSWRILAEDIQTLLNGDALASKTSSYHQWVQHVASYGEKNAAQASYWQPINQLTKQQLADDKHLWSEDINSAEFSLSADLTELLLRQAPAGYHSQINDLLLSALSMAMGQTFKRSRSVITLEGHGRECLDKTDVSRTLGWFTTVYPITLNSHLNSNLGSNPGSKVEKTIIQTKEALRAIPDKGIGFGTLAQQDLIDGQLPAIEFNYLGQFDASEIKDKRDWQLAFGLNGQALSPDNIEHLLLSINGAVRDAQLTFSATGRLQASLCQTLMQAFKAALCDVIEQAVSRAESGGFYTPSDFPQVNLTPEHLAQLQDKYDIEAIYPANSLQQGFIYHHLSQPQDDAYRVQLVLDYHTALDVRAYKSAWQHCSKQYPSMRTAFDWGAQPIQIIDKSYLLSDDNFDFQDISHLSGSHLLDKQREETIEKIQQRSRQDAFDLSQPGLMRFNLIKQTDHLFTVIQTAHHSISDGWSVSRQLQTVHQFYKQLIAGQQPVIEPDTAYFKANEWLFNHRHQTERYWQQQKAQYQQVNDLSLLLNEPGDLNQIRTMQQVRQSLLEFSGDEYQKIKAFTTQHGLTLNVLLQFAWHKLIQVYTRDQQTIVGTTVSGRDIPVAGIEDSVGLYINTLPLAVNWPSDSSILQQLKQLQSSIAELNSHHNISLASLQSNGKRLFHSLFVFENYPASDMESHVKIRNSIETTDYPLTLVAYESQSALAIALTYEAKLLASHQAQALLQKMRCIVQTVYQASDASLEMSHNKISLLDNKERQQLLIDFNQTQTDYPRQASLAQLFEQQVMRRPKHVALVCEQVQYSYAELDQHSERLAASLGAHGVKTNDTVAILSKRSADFVVAVVACVKAGASYIPLDIEYPVDRLDFIIQDASVSLLICQSDSHHLAHIQNRHPQLPLLFSNKSFTDNGFTDQRLTDKPLPTSPSDTPAAGPSADDIAYIIYTSGTTGQPKGVKIRHHSLINLCNWYQQEAQIKPDSVATQLVSFAFDASLLEIWPYLLSGAAVHIIASQMRQDLPTLSQYIAANQVSHCLVPTTLLNSFIETIQTTQHNLQVVMAGGERLSNFPYNNLPFRVYNGYGPTESTVATTCMLLDQAYKLPPIGKPIDNHKVYILGQTLNLLPIGAIGELYISGVGLSAGYLNREELTQQLFIDNQFATGEHSRLYKTGDLCRWLPDGNIQYIGRADRQLKIHGYRIEPGEIESALQALELIKQAVVCAQTLNGNKILAAYYVIRSNHSVTSAELSKELSNSLPEYMLPQSWTALDSIPLTINGKVDYKSLPAPVQTMESIYQAPTSELEYLLCQLWVEILQQEKVGIRDNFFSMGGDSISSIQLLSKLGQLGYSLKIQSLLANPTIEQLASQITCTSIAQNSQINKQLYQLQYGNDPTNGLTMVLIPAISGSIGVYNEFVDCLDDTYSVYAIQALGFEVEAEPLDSIEKIALHNVGLIKAHLTNEHLEGKSLTLVGYSFGCSIVFEMARLLSDTINISIVLLDGPNNLAESPLSQSLKQYNGLTDNEIEDNQFKNFLLHNFPIIKPSEPDFNQLDFSQKSRAEKITRAQDYLASIGINLSQQRLTSCYKVWQTHISISYQPREKLKNCQVLIISSTENDGEYQFPPDLLWGKHIEGEIKTLKIYADHFSLLKQPGVERVIQGIKKIEATWYKNIDLV